MTPADFLAQVQAEGHRGLEHGETVAAGWENEFGRFQEAPPMNGRTVRIVWCDRCRTLVLVAGLTGPRGGFAFMAHHDSGECRGRG